MRWQQTRLDGTHLDNLIPRTVRLGIPHRTASSVVGTEVSSVPSNVRAIGARAKRS